MSNQNPCVAMAIRQITTDAEIDRQLEEAVAVAKRFWVQRLSVVGEKCVNRHVLSQGLTLQCSGIVRRGNPKGTSRNIHQDISIGLPICGLQSDMSW